MTITVETPVRALPGAGPARAKQLEEAGLATAGDLLVYLPYRYEDRRHPVRIADIGRHVDTPVLLRGKVMNANLHITRLRRMKVFEAVLEDGTGAVKLVWFNQGFLADQIERGDRLSVFGAPKLSAYGQLQIESADWETFEGDDEADGAIVPIYSKVGKIPPKALRQIIGGALAALPSLDDPLPPALRKRLGVIDLAPALEQIHRPPQLDGAFLGRRSPAHVRIIMQEFFTLQLALRVRRASEEVKTKTRKITVDDNLRAEVKRILPFRLTKAQKRVLKEIATDLQSEKPMYRLLEGDVGSGKTIVALIAAIIMIRNGHQVALLAPTEILAEQHYQRIRQLVDESLVVAKATGSMAAGERRTFLAGLRDGIIQLVVGTHALLEDRVVFKSLGLAIVDEQHRFGVEQRQRLFAKGDTPDIMVMTATPIPRSLALAMYGDLELSVIDEMPPGRQQIKTAVRSASQIERVYQFINTEIDAGAQTYIVYPIIEESEKSNLKPLTIGFEATKLRFPDRRVAMIHGRMPAAEKEETMQRFKRGEIDILVSTTVIEVGIDVANASLMLIIDADRFGLSQLHQLRGRVGRGTRQSYCVLVSDKEKERLTQFAKTLNGFDLADLDLKLRGPGELLGTRQSGAMRFRFGHIVRDFELMEKARDLAIEIIEKSGLEKVEKVVRKLLGASIPATVKD
ncbi:MAG TPA: ATP-dependent DNA helicase RecG [Thermoanaerobaculia bacterium]|nr:ATP-dependent DNA helicase RecG [Thermoanaerobaculia bacterium]